MKLYEEFRVDQPLDTVWGFFEQPELVARCIPGVERVKVVDSDNVQVLATQRIGPMSATFEANVTILERGPFEYIRFQATGKSVRGAIGNVRTSNTVRLDAEPDATRVSVEGDLVLAGALGSVGQKVVAKQASKAAAAFAENLRRALAGETSPSLAASTAVDGEAMPAAARAPVAAGRLSSNSSPLHDGWVQVTPALVGGPRADTWPKVAAALSALSACLSVAVLVKLRGRR